MKVEEHPVARLFPGMSGPEYRDLIADIRANGLRAPIVLWRGKLIDGRHRLRACLAAGVDPQFQEVDCPGEDLGRLVWSLNAVRRQLTTSQKAAVAARLSEGSTVGRPRKTENSSDETIIPQHVAAEMVGVSVAQVKRAALVRKEDPELDRQVHAGKISVSNAAGVIRERAINWGPKGPPRAPKGMDAVNIVYRKRLDSAFKLAKKLEGDLDMIDALRPERLGGVTVQASREVEERVLRLGAEICKRVGASLRAAEAAEADTSSDRLH